MIVIIIHLKASLKHTSSYHDPNKSGICRLIDEN